MTTLLVASGGGHLAQLHHLRPRLGVGDDVCWVTFDTPQSRSLLAGEEVVYCPFTGSRDLRGTGRNLLLARRLLGTGRFDTVVSTGAAIAVPYLAVGARHGCSCHYIESATRVVGPSLSGRILRWTPGTHVYCQSASWAGGPWRFVGSIFDSFEVHPGPEPRPALERAVVTLGTMPFPFRRLVERLVALLPSASDVLWQTGATPVDGLGLQARASVPWQELSTALQAADIVVSHAGTGAALDALEAGRCPVLVPREQARGEHVDDHQWEIAQELDRRGLAIVRPAEALTLDDLLEAASRRVERASSPPPITLSM